MSVCHRCERQDEGGLWLTVQQRGAYPRTWEFCTAECLGQHFEARPAYSPYIVRPESPRCEALSLAGFRCVMEAGHQGEWHQFGPPRDGDVAA